MAEPAPGARSCYAISSPLDAGSRWSWQTSWKQQSAADRTRAALSALPTTCHTSGSVTDCTYSLWVMSLSLSDLSLRLMFFLDRVFDLTSSGMGWTISRTRASRGHSLPHHVLAYLCYPGAAAFHTTRVKSLSFACSGRLYVSLLGIPGAQDAPYWWTPSVGLLTVASQIPVTRLTVRHRCQGVREPARSVLVHRVTGRQSDPRHLASFTGCVADPRGSFEPMGTPIVIIVREFGERKALSIVAQRMCISSGTLLCSS